MPPQVHDLSTASTPKPEAEAYTLDELRERVGEIAADLSKVAEQRTRAARQSVEAGADNLRSTIRRQPAVSVGVAVLAGALLAVLVVPRKSAASEKTRWTDWSPVTRADFHDFADTIQRSMSRSLNAVPVTSTLERLAETVSRVDNGAGISSAVEKIGAWLQQKTAAATDKK